MLREIEFKQPSRLSNHQASTISPQWILPAPHGFGRAVIHGLDHSTGDDVDRILCEMNRCQDRHHALYLLIGGMNFLLNHKPVLTYDVDLWILDTAENRLHVHHAIQALESAWGATEEAWGLLPETADWLEHQSIVCLTSPHGAIDIFQEVLGLENRFQPCWDAAGREATASGVPD